MEQKKEIIAKYESGIRVIELSTRNGIPRSTISTFVQHKEAIKSTDVANGVFSITKLQSPIIDEID